MQSLQMHEGQREERYIDLTHVRGKQVCYAWTPNYGWTTYMLAALLSIKDLYSFESESYTAAAKWVILATGNTLSESLINQTIAGVSLLGIRIFERGSFEILFTYTTLGVRPQRTKYVLWVDSDSGDRVGQMLVSAQGHRDVSV